MLVLADRVKVTSHTSGTGTITLGPAQFSFRDFSAVGDGNETYYGIVDNVGNWEIGRGTYTAIPNTLSRDSIVSSSNGNTKVNFAVGAKNVFCTFPSSLAEVNFAGSGGALGNFAFYGSTIDTNNGTDIAVEKNLTVHGNVTVDGVITGGSINRLINNGSLVTLDSEGKLTFADGAFWQSGELYNTTNIKIFSDEYVKIKAGNAYFYVDTTDTLRITSNLNHWVFTSSGEFVFPNESIQTTAWLGEANLVDVPAESLIGTIPENVLNNSNLYVGTTEINLTRLPASQTLTGISIDGNSYTATGLETARTINGILFDGRNDIVVPTSPSSYFSRQHSTSFEIGSDVETVIIFDTELDDAISTTGITYDDVDHPGRFTNLSGEIRLFSISTAVAYNPNNSGVRATYIKKNGSLKIAGTKTNAVDSDSTTHNLSVQVALSNGEYFEVYGYQTCGANLSTGDDISGNYISVAWI